MAEPKVEAKRIGVLDPLRGVAALAVCLFHSKGILPHNFWIGAILEYGWLGVDMFFVISGFVIPYSLHMGNYKFSNFGNFIVKRAKRLHPPYLATIAIVFMQFQIYSIIPGLTPRQRDWSLWGHFFLINGFLDKDWLLGVYWTLAIEFQFYVLLSLLFPLIVHGTAAIRFLTVLLIALSSALPIKIVDVYGNEELVFHWLPIFGIGMLTFQYLCKFLSFSLFVIGVLACSLVSVAEVGIQETIVALGSATAIVAFRSCRFSPKNLFVFLGKISYSLYLCHSIVGQVVFAIARRLPSSLIVDYCFFFLAVILSVVASWLFWKLVEEPSRIWARGPKDHL